MAAEESIKDAPATEDAEELKAELERLKAENEKLAQGGNSHAFWRNLIAAVCIAIGVITLAAAISAVWLNRTIMDENRWVETMAPLAQNASVQNYVATKATDSLFAAVDIQGYVAKALQPLPPAVQGLATPIASAIQGFIRDQATKFVRSDQFPVMWEKMLRLAHQAFIASITQRQGGLINNQAGKVTLDVSVLIDQMKAQLSSRGLGFVNAVPTPASAHDIVLVDSPVLGQLSLVIQVMNSAALVLPFVALGLLALGVGLAVDRRKAVLWLGIGVVVVTILPVQAIYLGQFPFAQAALRVGQVPTAASQAAYSIIFRNLIRADRLFALLGVIFVLGAMVTGPSAWATALRRGLSHGIDNIGPEWDFGQPGEWIYAHRSGMRAAGVIGAIVILVIVRVSSIWTIVWLIVGVLVWLALVQLFGRPRPALRMADEAGSDDSASSDDGATTA